MLVATHDPEAMGVFDRTVTLEQGVVIDDTGADTPAADSSDAGEAETPS